jgi:hypothetical protein
MTKAQTAALLGGCFLFFYKDFNPFFIKIFYASGNEKEKEKTVKTHFFVKYSCQNNVLFLNIRVIIGRGEQSLFG